MGKKRKVGGKRQNGLTVDKIKDLKNDIRAASRAFGERKVSDVLGFSTTKAALKEINVDMPKSEFGKAANAIKKLSKPEPKRNKYAHLANNR